MNTLQGKTAIVTGAASGIGRASALLFAAEGAAVVALDRAAEVEATVAAIRAAGGRGDCLGQGFLRGGRCRRRGGHGAARNTAASMPAMRMPASAAAWCPFFEETVDHWMEVLKVNLIGTFLLAKYAAKEMIKQKRGSIICTASVAGLRSGAGGVPYSASKAGVISLVQTVGLSADRHGRTHQCHLPRPDRNRHDAADVRARARTRQRTQDRTTQSPAAFRRAARNRADGACFSPPMRPLTSTAKPSQWTAACPARIPSLSGVTSP